MSLRKLIRENRELAERGFQNVVGEDEEGHRAAHFQLALRRYQIAVNKLWKEIFGVKK